MTRTRDVEAFEALYRQTADRVMAYCLRHADPGTAEDALSETYATAWRRFSDDVDLPWLIITAKNHLRNGRRSRMRQVALAERIHRWERLATPTPDITVDHRQTLFTALGALSEDDREAILLTCWDGLTSAEAARVLGTTPGALRVRIHRARARMVAAIDDRAPENKEGSNDD